MKKELRNKYRQIRKEVSSSFEKKYQSHYLHFFIDRLFKLSSASDYLLYASLPEEFPTRDLFLRLKAYDKRVFFPRLDGNDLRFYQVENWADLKNTGFLLEPTSAENRKWNGESSSIAIVPGVVFNRQAHRIGYGKAFYDRFLSNHPEVIRIGLAFNEQLAPSIWPTEAHDQALDYVLCPSGVWGSSRPVQ